ncbi:TetR/AcrR family transcriptional regulator [Undibacterium sp.]|uniref:TetR/AcrR family transcriptional regulator n=1 Tax=Undibacterium sp. TaxID=1914977 RepID=UPI002CA51A65|nr:TetR/AcrR family transcriptional regulator [Undibacterium sp.]HTD05588.1 TetR/AcrR family transcriptional regulator [Undibacterium sp.]
MAARRKQILDAASASIQEKGVAGLSISDISGSAGLSVGAIYTHFKSKEEILASLITQDNGVGNADLFKDCPTIDATLHRLTALLQQVQNDGEATLKGHIAIQVVVLAHRSELVHNAIELQYRGLRDAVMAQVALLQAASAQQANQKLAAMVGECLLGLMLSVQFQRLAGITPDTEAKILAAKNLLELLQASPLKP